jgi:hypothetical protein
MAEEYISEDALTGLYGGDTTATPDIWGFLKPYKSVFDKITGGTAGANEYAAAAGILGLLIPSLNEPKTRGWKGSIDMGKQFTRTPIAQPAYTPYAQSASPVMGRQYFTSSYGPPPAASGTGASGGSGGAADTTVVDDPTKSGVGGALARGGLASLASGGRAERPKFKEQDRLEHTTKDEQPQIRVSNFGDEGGWGFGPGHYFDPVDQLAKSSNIFVQRGNDAVVSDEIFWNPHSPVGEELQKRVQSVQSDGKRAGIVVTPYAFFQGKATNEQLLDEIKNSGSDFVILDPYLLGFGASSDELLDWTKNFTSEINKLGKEVKLATQGFAPKGMEQQVLDYNKQLLSIPGINEFANLGWEDAEDVMANPYFVNLNNDFTKGQQYLLPEDQVTSLQPSVASQSGATSSTQKTGNALDLNRQPVQAQQQAEGTGIAAAPQMQFDSYGTQQLDGLSNFKPAIQEQLSGFGFDTNIAGAGDLTDFKRVIQEDKTQAAPVGFPVTPSGIAQPVPQFMPDRMPQPMPEPMPRSPIPFEEEGREQVQAAHGGLMGLARGGRAMPPRYLRGETDGMEDKIPSNIDGVQPAKLSHGEFVIPADVVSHLGNGNSDAGAKVLYKMMDRVRQARTGTKKQGRQINPEKFTPGGIAGYAGGGAVAFTAGGSTGTATGGTANTLGTSTETNISEWAGPYVGDMLSKTVALTNTPYQAYQGPLVAGTAPLQSKVFQGLQGLNFPGQLGQSFTAQGAYQLPSMTASGVTGQATGPTGIASQYMNPYLNAVLTPQLEELRRQSQITQMGTAGKLAQAGAFGGSRQAIMDAETQRNLLAEQNKAIGTGYANAYDKAMGQFNTEQGQAKTLADMMAGAGTQQRGIEQEGITALQKQYETELLDPYVKLRFQKEMLQGLPVQTVSTTGNQSTMDQVKGGLSDIQTLMKALGLA